MPVMLWMMVQCRAKASLLVYVCKISCAIWGCVSAERRDRKLPWGQRRYSQSSCSPRTVNHCKCLSSDPKRTLPHCGDPFQICERDVNFAPGHIGRTSFCLCALVKALYYSSFWHLHALCVLHFLSLRVCVSNFPLTGLNLPSFGEPDIDCCRLLDVF